MILDFAALAYKSVKNRQLRSWLTMIGIIIGIATVVALISLGQGMQDAISEQFSSLGTDKVFIEARGHAFGPPGVGAPAQLTEDDFDVIERSHGVQATVGRLIRIGEISFGDEIAFEYVVNMPKAQEERELVINAWKYVVEKGRMIRPQDSKKVVLGDNYATKKKFRRNLEVGDKVTIQGKVFKIAGFLKRQGNFEVDDSILMTEDSMRNVFDLKDEWDVFMAKVSPGFEVPQVVETIRKNLRKSRNVKEGKEDFVIQTPEDILATVNNILLILQAVLIGIAATSLVVGGIGIMNTTYTSVLERTKEIGIMKSIGARNSDILTIFLLESGFYGLAGGAMGVTVGLGMSYLVQALANQALGTSLIGASFSPFLIVGSLVFSFVVGCLSGIIPARQASKLKPVDALRYE